MVLLLLPLLLLLLLRLFFGAHSAVRCVHYDQQPFRPIAQVGSGVPITQVGSGVLAIPIMQVGSGVSARQWYEGLAPSPGSNLTITSTSTFGYSLHGATVHLQWYDENGVEVSFCMKLESGSLPRGTFSKLPGKRVVISDIDTEEDIMMIEYEHHDGTRWILQGKHNWPTYKPLRRASSGVPASNTSG